MKLIGHARMVDAATDPGLAERLQTDGEGPVERVTEIAVTAIDWSCPKFITPRFNEAEIAAMLVPKIRKLEQENAALRARLAAL